MAHTVIFPISIQCYYSIYLTVEAPLTTPQSGSRFVPDSLSKLLGLLLFVLLVALVYSVIVSFSTGYTDLIKFFRIHQD